MWLRHCPSSYPSAYHPSVGKTVESREELSGAILLRHPLRQCQESYVQANHCHRNGLHGLLGIR